MTASTLLFQRESATALHPGDQVPSGVTYLPSTPEHVLWGELPCSTDRPVLRIDPAMEVVVDTISHEGILEDQGRDPVTFFGRHGVDPELVLHDARRLAASSVERLGKNLGAHVVTGPIAVTGARPGDLLKITVLETIPRASYGVLSNRHGRGSLPGE